MLLTFQIPSSSFLNILPAHSHNTSALLHSQVGMDMANMINTQFRKASASSANTQAAGPSQGAFSGAPALPSTTVLPNAISYSSSENSTKSRFHLLPCKRNFVGQDENFKKVVEFLQDSKVGKVGIYGMGGVGKTSLLERIHNEYLAISGFDLIIWIPLDQDVDYQNIWRIINVTENVDRWFYFPLPGIYNPRDDLWSIFLGRISDLPSKSNATELYNFLIGKKFVLVMDNMWEYVDLKELGIPEPTEENMCKVVFTTRSEEVCRPMNPDREIKVECLGRNDSWALFKENVGGRALNSDPRVCGIAELVVKECGGLPLALILVGRAMSSRWGKERWDNALTLLQSYPYELQCIEKNLYHFLKFSYDALENETVKQCFLYCSLFPDGFHINKDKLVEYWMGEGYLGESESLKNLKNRGYEIVGVLESVCLLECGRAGSVKMHDVVRDMALWIVSGYGKEKDRFFVHQMSRGLARFVIEEKWSKANKIFVMDLVDLPVQPACPNLSTLLFDENIPQIMFEQNAIPGQRVKDEDSDRPRQLPSMQNPIDNLFENMPGLEVLELSSFPIPGMVSRLVALRYLSCLIIECSEINVGSLNKLWFLNLTGYSVEENFCIIGLDQMTELRQLNLKYGNLKTLPVEVGRLTKLESLDLAMADITKLPSTVGQLVNLRYLDLERTILEMLPVEFGGMTKLTDLNLSYTGITELPSTVGQLVNLRYLDLGGTKLKTLPIEVVGMTKLTELNLSYTGITELPRTIEQLVNLQNLDVGRTKLKTLPIEVGGMTKLTDLNLSYTDITELPRTMKQLVNLQNLDVRATNLKTLPKELNDLSNLKIRINERSRRTTQLPN